MKEQLDAVLIDQTALKEVREALAAYVEADHKRDYQGNDEPGCSLRVWVSDWDRGKKALSLLNQLLLSREGEAKETKCD